MVAGRDVSVPMNIHERTARKVRIYEGQAIGLISYFELQILRLITNKMLLFRNILLLCRLMEVY